MKKIYGKKSYSYEMILQTGSKKNMKILQEYGMLKNRY